MAQSYAHLYGLPPTMFRFFTVYGPWGRPDMAYFLFTDAIMKGKPINVFNHGKMERDFTYIDDLIDGIAGLIDAVPGDEPVSEQDSLSPVAPFRVVNIGSDRPAALIDFIEAIEDACGQKAEKIMHPMQPGDVPATWADTRLLRQLTGCTAQVDLRTGTSRFVEWYKDLYSPS
jgi:UDP-glucuronate 4-epimerase